MTINNLIRDEKLQHDINREAAKISALSSCKIHKYEYLTTEETLPSNQQQIIQQAKFTYSPLRKAFEKQTKTIEDQGKKQVEALKNLKSIEDIYDDKTSTQKESYNRLLNERIYEIQEIAKKIDCNNLIYHFKTPSIPSINLVGFRGPFHIYNEMKNGNKTIQTAEEEQIKSKSELNSITSGNPKYKSKKINQTQQKVLKIFMIQDKKLLI